MPWPNSPKPQPTPPMQPTPYNPKPKKTIPPPPKKPKA